MYTSASYILRMAGQADDIEHIIGDKRCRNHWMVAEVSLYDACLILSAVSKAQFSQIPASRSARIRLRHLFQYSECRVVTPEYLCLFLHNTHTHTHTHTLPFNSLGLPW